MILCVCVCDGWGVHYLCFNVFVFMCVCLHECMAVCVIKIVT